MKVVKKILILGSAGQIGSHLTKYLKKKNFITYEFDIVNNKKQDLRINANSILNNLIKKSDFIFFLAFDVGGSRYLKLYQDSAQFISNNLLIMENTFSLIRKHNKKFIFASSQMSNMGYSNYGLLKRIGENYTKILKGITVKFWNVYGFEKDNSKSHVITDFILNGLKSENVKMLTNGKEEREFLYAEDCCRALEIIMKNFLIFKKKTSEIHLTSNKLSSILNVAKIVTKLFIVKGKRVKFIPAKTKDTVQLNKKNKANKFLFKYWRPKFSLNQGIQEVLDYYWDRSKKI
jgi:nucleoside-diphosphate-sugar epimerase